MKIKIRALLERKRDLDNLATSLNALKETKPETGMFEIRDMLVEEVQDTLIQYKDLLNALIDSAEVTL